MKPLFTRGADEIFSGACLDVAIAAAKGKLKRLDQLLADKDLANCQGASGATPLYWAIAAKKTSVVGAERLLMAGADPNHYVESGKTIVHIAVMRGDERIVRLLLKHGANPNIEDQRSGKTPLFFIQPGGYPVVAPLLDAGADPNHRENFGETAMMSMVPIGQFRAIDALLMAGADWRIESRSGGTLSKRIKLLGPRIDEQSDEYEYYLKVREFLRAHGEAL